MKLALYRKYRPTKFSDVIGQDDVVTALRNQLTTGQLGHAYIFTGIRGTGKTTLAKILAKAVNCPNSVDGEPCGVCPICKGIDNGSVMDVTEMDAASNSRVDDVRELLDETHYTPVECKMRVYIVDEVHMMSASAFNALLKTIEEPPAHVMFIFATTEINKVPITIRSRCQRFDLRRIPEQKIVERLNYVSSCEGIELSEEGAQLIARLAGGAMRDALSMLDTCASYGTAVDAQTVKRVSGLTDKSYLFTMSEEIRKGDCNGLIKTIHSLYADGGDASRLLTELVRHYRDLLMVGSGSVTLSDCTEEVQKQYNSVSRTYTVKELLHILDMLATAADRMGKSLDNDVAFELAVLQLAGEKVANGRTPEPIAYVPAQQPVQEVRYEEPAIQSKQTESDQVHEIQPEPSAIETAVTTSPDEKEVKETVLQDQDVMWQQVLSIIKDRKRVLASTLANSVPHITDAHLLIEAGDMAFQFIRNNPDSRQVIKDAFYEVTGLKRNIGPWKSETKEEKKDEDDGLDAFLEQAAAQGIPIQTKQEITE